MKLVIISHTEHYKTTNGTVVGWGPTVNEINHLLAVFDKIYHVAMLYEGVPPASAMAYTDRRIIFVPLTPSGGSTILSKLHIVLQAPRVIKIVSQTLQQVDCFQLRAPTGIGVYLIPYLTWFSRKKGWFKYAGNWNQKHPPLGYRIQRYLLKRQLRKVTINGQWPHQPTQCLTFENPCLTLENLTQGKIVVQQKTKVDKLNFCFVGRLEKAKGVELIIKAFGLLGAEDKTKIGSVHLVGDGKTTAYFKALATEITGIEFEFHGFLSRAEVFNIYKLSHYFLLPSMASEGFPKVIAEAMNFGCVPIVSSVSSIAQYINIKNGIVLHDVSLPTLTQALRYCIGLSTLERRNLMNGSLPLLEKFSYAYYNQRLLSEVLINIPIVN